MVGVVDIELSFFHLETRMSLNVVFVLDVDESWERQRLGAGAETQSMLDTTYYLPQKRLSLDVVKAAG